ncbi:iron only hydrogenase large subunit-like protein [Caldicellulosiruptor bescii]|uniref:Fe-S cluster domain protein n=2 Tax=Caldicellulosiruptor bescii TaxID=31899 RepID=B9MRT8_CALBD|nr:[Fe-Fe] hydrogenase large subunit C-terminal domain-containing protein [Caldicellulosiruptor bescii]ACM60392.1 Fe-S cluster domain protein [Caldicellulosiruptor bescii DSM 6725]PBC87806.1 iron only hydrogenase large subunit-like protein [Caldicellulosiruptor bescii]PBC90738.1 iron only hydrogenase large subunit-like protein [Caldicellulosiruptor bescii]PBD03829.1 iron only hydrogenase large subunit-like protein [Caldicellulosiruptor bescii]PBD06536.1 iron only hydrogenase large subunit-like
MKNLHSIMLDKEKCKGCTNCIKRCPTEAIRVRNSKARIIDQRCIDCGECIRTCPYHAKYAITDSLEEINKFQYKVALPAPSFYAQFEVDDVNKLLYALLNLGFDDIFEVAKAAEIVTHFTKQFILSDKNKKPVISSACPAVVRLIQTKFPDLIENILPIASPMEVAAYIAKKKIHKEKGIDEDKIGAFFISPCAAKMTYINNPLGFERSYVDGVIAIKDIYGLVRSKLREIKVIKPLSITSGKGIGWAASGGESLALEIEEYINVDGIHNVVKVLEEIENGRLKDITYFEGLACTGGCVGGPLAVENPYVAKNRIKRLSSKLKDKEESLSAWTAEIINSFSLRLEDVLFEKELETNPVLELDSDIERAIEKFEKANNILSILPGLDCGACGSPTCKTLAEDIVRGFANDTDCIFILRESIKELANKMVELSNKLPPSLERNDE